MENMMVLEGNRGFVHINNDLEIINPQINVSIHYNNLSDLYQELDIIAEDEEKHNLKWAFTNAQSKLQITMENIINEYAHKQRETQQGEESNDEYMKLENISRLAKKKAELKVRMFKIASSMVTLVDILISLALVMIISNISHTGEAHISSEILSFLFVFFFALLKVTLEKYIIVPSVERWGWKLYKKIINSYKDNMGHCVSCLKNKGISNAYHIRTLGESGQ